MDDKPDWGTWIIIMGILLSNLGEHKQHYIYYGTEQIPVGIAGDHLPEVNRDYVHLKDNLVSPISGGGSGIGFGWEDTNFIVKNFS